LPSIAPEDPEPEFVAINGENEIVVTMQENNHMVVLAADGTVLSHFSAGEVTLEGVDTEEEGALVFDQTITVPREPDSVTWIDDTHFAIANEGDMDGGSRGWTIFSQDGEVIYESGTSFEYAIIEIGHYPEERSGNKGVEPESATFDVFGGTPYLFIGSERGSVVGVYNVTDPANPVLSSFCRRGSGRKATSRSRNAGFWSRPTRRRCRPARPCDDLRISGRTGGLSAPDLGGHGRTDRLGRDLGAGDGRGRDDLRRVGQLLRHAADDLPHRRERNPGADRGRHPRHAGGPACATDGHGRASRSTVTAVSGSRPRAGRTAWCRTRSTMSAATGRSRTTSRCRTSFWRSRCRFGFEGITRVGDMLYLAVQREWRDDPAGHAKVLGYNLDTEEWSVIHYPLTPAETGWVGLSEIVAHGDYVYFIERDNQFENAVTKQITRVPLSAMDGMVALGKRPRCWSPNLWSTFCPTSPPPAATSSTRSRVWRSRKTGRCGCRPTMTASTTIRARRCSSPSNRCEGGKVH
jgi:hypothetical protein